MKIAALTDIGSCRQENQDNYCARQLVDGTGWGLVCDGMGGANGGRVASTLATQTMLRYFDHSLRTIENGEEKAFMMRAFDNANRAVYEKATSDPEVLGMGTTGVCALQRGNLAHIVHAGDSRAYLWHGGAIRQLTRDHSMVQQLVDSGLVKTAADLYSLRPEQIEVLDRMGKKSAQNAVEAIARSREDDLWRLIFALGIRQVGEKAAKVLAARFGTMDALTAATEEELTAIDDVGPITAKYIRQWMDSSQSQDLLERLRAAGLNMACKEKMVDSRFAGMTFVLTGALEKFTRDEAGEMIEKRGGKASGSVSKKTTYVVAGENAGGKLQKAQQLGIPVLTEDEFLELLK